MMLRYSEWCNTYQLGSLFHLCVLWTLGLEVDSYFPPVSRRCLYHLLQLCHLFCPQ